MLLSPSAEWMASRLIALDQPEQSTGLAPEDGNLSDCLYRWMPEPVRPAAVLIPFLRSAEGWRILLTRRTDRVETHKGQVAFPGGRMDDGDGSPAATALREAFEEIGVFPQDVRLLGRLDKVPAMTGYCVTPVVGIIPWPYRLRLAPDEVSRVFTIPLAWLANPDHREARPWVWESPDGPISFETIYFDRYDGELLWGLSAQIMVNLLKVLQLA